jgi:hypothetical protein
MPRVNLIQLRRDTAANWTSTNPTLAAGETGFETDTRLTKVGTGAATWTALPYTAASVADGSITTAKFAPTASTTFVGGKRIIVQTTTPTAPAGGFGVGDVWISYTA